MNLNQNPLFGAILATTSVVSGGCAVAAGLAIREIYLHSWGCYPVEEMDVLMVQLIVSVAVCLGAAFWWTYQTSPSESNSKQGERSMKHNQSLITLALIAGAVVGAVQTVAGNPSAALTGRLAGEFLGAAVIYIVVFWALLAQSDAAGQAAQRQRPDLHRNAEEPI